MRHRGRTREAGRSRAANTQTSPRLVSGVIAANGLTLTLTFDVAVTGQSASGNGDIVEDIAISQYTISYSSGTGTTSLVYGIEKLGGLPVTIGTQIFVRKVKTSTLGHNGILLAFFHKFLLTNNSTQV